MAADELHEAWAKLDHLETQERYLVERLSDIRKAIKAQKLKISDLGPPTINRLPTELLSQIFTFCVPDPKFPEKPLHRIVGASHRWRNIVWNNPTFWTSIKVTPIQGEKGLKMQLKRSRNALLDIWIEDWDDCRALYDSYGKLHAFLDAIVPHANRWRSLIISDSMEPEFVESILPKINHLSAPFLREFSIDMLDDLDHLPCPDFLSPTRAPALEHLTLRPAFQLDSFMALPTLKMLHLTFSHADNHLPVISMLTPAQSLTLLVLDGNSTGWSLRRNDLHCPLLEKLTLYVDKPVPFLEAIVAPKLRYVRCWILDLVEFDTIEGKFRDVHDLSLIFSSIEDQGTEPLCRAFPGVRRVHVSARNASFLTTGIHGSGVLERRPPMDQWLDLETVTFNDFDCEWLKRWELGEDPIVKWLRGRQESGLSRLCVRLLIREDEDKLSVYYALLERHCDLEIFTRLT